MGRPPYSTPVPEHNSWIDNINSLVTGAFWIGVVLLISVVCFVVWRAWTHHGTDPVVVADPSTPASQTTVDQYDDGSKPTERKYVGKTTALSPNVIHDLEEKYCQKQFQVPLIKMAFIDWKYAVNNDQYDSIVCDLVDEKARYAMPAGYAQPTPSLTSADLTQELHEQEAQHPAAKWAYNPDKPIIKLPPKPEKSELADVKAAQVTINKADKWIQHDWIKQHPKQDTKASNGPPVPEG